MPGPERAHQANYGCRADLFHSLPFNAIIGDDQCGLTFWIPIEIKGDVGFFAIDTV
jgi:hypothetical protein